MIGIKIPWQVWACAGLVAAVAGYGELRHHQGKREVKKEWQKSVERGRVIVETLKLRQGVVTTITQTIYETKVKVIREKGDAIVKYVEVFVPQDVPDLPGGIRVLHDAAATNSIPDSSRVADAAAVSAQDLTRTVAENYATCHQTTQQLLSLQQWIRDQGQAASLQAGSTQPETLQ